MTTTMIVTDAIVVNLQRRGIATDCFRKECEADDETVEHLMLLSWTGLRRVLGK